MPRTTTAHGTAQRNRAALASIVKQAQQYEHALGRSLVAYQCRTAQRNALRVVEAAAQVSDSAAGVQWSQRVAYWTDALYRLDKFATFYNAHPLHPAA